MLKMKKELNSYFINIFNDNKFMKRCKVRYVKLKFIKCVKFKIN